MLANLIKQRRPILGVFALYAVEFLDEFIYGLHGAVLPTLKTDLGLSYTQVGLLFTLPALVAIFAEPLIGLLGDTAHRRLIVLGGVAATCISLVLVAIGQVYLFILIAYVVMASASGAYVNLSQATLIDRNPMRAEPTMARWVLVGEVAVTLSPLIVTVVFGLGFGWRGLYWGLAGMAGCFVALLWPVRFAEHDGAEDESIAPRKLLTMFWEGLRNGDLLRWVLLTEVADLMLDKHLEVTGLYFHDVVGVSLTTASGVVAWMSLVGLIGSIIFVPLIERIDGLKLLRSTALIVLITYIIYLLVPQMWVKIGLIAILSFCTASWFPTLRAKSFQALEGQSGVVTAVSSVANLSSLFVPLVIGSLADAFGLQWAMWLLALGPLALLIWLPRELQ